MEPADLAAARRLLDCDAPAAVAIARRAVAAAPAGIEARFVLAAALRRTGDSAGACDLLEPLAIERPAAWGIHHELGLARAAAGETDAALAALDRAVALNPASTRAAAAVAGVRGVAAMARGDVATAVAAFAAGTAADPADAAGWHNLGHALRARGDTAGAVTAYRRALAAEPMFAEAWWSLANLKTLIFSPADVAAMTALLARDSPAADGAALRFALGKAAADGGAPAAAFAHYAAANAAAGPGFDRAAHAAFVDRSIATFTPAFFAARAGSGDPAAAPIFVVGLPRSGSTLVEQILASHPAIEGLGELADLPAVARSLVAAYPTDLADLSPAALAAAGRAYRDRVEPRRGARPHFVDKFPGNFLHAGLIHLLLPNAAIVDVRRASVACCWSLFTHRFAAGQGYAYDLGDLGAYYRDYLRLMDHFATVLPGRILTVSYEALIDDTEAEVRRLLAHLGLAFDPACLAFFATDRPVRTPSSAQVRQPIFRSGLDRWRPFTPWLGPLFDALGARAG